MTEARACYRVDLRCHACTSEHWIRATVKIGGLKLFVQQSRLSDGKKQKYLCLVKVQRFSASSRYARGRAMSTADSRSFYQQDVATRVLILSRLCCRPSFLSLSFLALNPTGLVCAKFIATRATCKSRCFLSGLWLPQMMLRNPFLLISSSACNSTRCNMRWGSAGSSSFWARFHGLRHEAEIGNVREATEYCCSHQVGCNTVTKEGWYSASESRRNELTAWSQK